MIKKSEKSKLGDAQGIPFFINLSGSSPETIFLFGHILCALLGGSVCFFFFVFE